MNRLLEKYKTEVLPKLNKQFGYSSVMETPKLEKIVLNMRAGDATHDSKVIDEVVSYLTDISGQKPVVTKAKKSIATWKLREGQAIGAKVTLRGVRMYEFVDKLVTIALPRARDFRGVSKNAFDGRGNYTLGIKEQTIFPEIKYSATNRIRGLDIIIVTTAKTDEEAKVLLTEFGFPFQK
jgi:large subunit ribosomal protein L5